MSKSKLESKFQKDLMDEIKRLYPGCVIIKNDSGYIQGFPDWTILYKDKWAVLETKREKGASKQPNQEYYVTKLNTMSFSRFVYPENKEEVLHELHKTFKP
jgi:3-hydroxymyristoyl/3-hydroxydecanoyl-(acyl carrier protein) dehydratase